MDKESSTQIYRESAGGARVSLIPTSISPMEGDQDHVVVPSASVRNTASCSIPRPPQCSLWDDETWAMLGEERQREISKIYSTKIEFSNGYRRFVDEFIVGTDGENLDCPDAPSNSDGSTQSIRPWRIFTDPVAQDKLLAMGNEYHDESERKELEAMRLRQHLGSDGAYVESRDVRLSDTLLFLRNCAVHCSVPGESLLGPMRYTSCELRDKCLHFPSPMLQIFDVKVRCNWHDDIVGPYTESIYDLIHWKVDIYGMIAIRDPLDNSRNYIFHRSRENAQAINMNGGYLCMKNPSRGISAMNCLIEIDVKIKAENVEEDCTIVDGCVKAVGLFDHWRMNHVDSINGIVTFESCVFNEGVEATIELDFVEVPAGGFHVRMCGNTVLSKGVYSFINERRLDCDGFISMTGKYGQKFVAAVSIGDTLLIDFMEKGGHTVSFVASKHGKEHQRYRFSNGAVVSVQVYWSTIEIVDPVCKEAVTG